MEEESRLARSEPDFGGEKKTEVRFEAKNAYLAILDGYCSGTGKCRMSVINGLLEDWAKAKAREDEVRAQTVEWLCKHGCMGNNPTGFMPAWPFLAPERFRMRKAGDHRDDVTLKSSWLSEIEPPEYARLTAVFDDRDRVVQMWRDAGVTCFQVAPGEF